MAHDLHWILSKVSIRTIDRVLRNYIVDTHGCHIYQGYKRREGYGVLTTRIEGKRYKIRVPRLVWCWYHWQDPGELVVCHSCDNPSCMNVEHLFPAEQLVNMQDMVAKGRHQNGAKAFVRRISSMTI